MLLTARPLELLPLSPAAGSSGGRRNDRDAMLAAGDSIGLFGTGLRLIVLLNGDDGTFAFVERLGLRGPVLVCRRPSIGDSSISSSGSDTSATACKLV